MAPRVYAFGLGNYLEFFTEPLYWRTFARTAVMSILVTALTLVLGFPLALYIARVARGAEGDAAPACACCRSGCRNSCARSAG